MAKYIDRDALKDRMLNNGVPIGNLQETIIFLEMVEAAKEE